ncbi:MAG: citrate (Si)-synthase [Candidatus Aminicenantia bacterium]
MTQQKSLKLKVRLAELVPKWREERTKLVKELGDISIDKVTVEQALGGMRDVKILPCETSYLDPIEGIRFRGMTIPEVREKLPRPAPEDEPYPTGLWYLLLTGEIPSKEEVLELEEEIKNRQEVPKYVFDVINALPKDTHPMTQISIGVLAMQRDSVFVKRYNEGMKRDEHWDATFEDSLTLNARMPVIAGYIYRRTYKDGKFIPPDPKLDWGANFAHMMGIDNSEYYNLMRLYLILHSDHESGNVSAHTGFLVNSAWSDVYYSISAALNGLAGPLHGLANQECLKWILDLMEEYKGVPTKEQVEEYTWKTLNSGQVVPGYGHAVLRNVDPRYTAQREFALRYCPDDPVFKTVSNVFEVVPDVLKKHGKAKNPWPNVDAHSGCLQYHYGVKEFDFYTVLFGVSRTMGITAQAVWARGVYFPIERPKSLTLAMIREAAEKGI